MSNYGLLTTSPTNIGEEIQQLASLRFLPNVDELVHRDRISDYISKNNQQTKLIMNGWWMWEEHHFPPSSYIEPLMISMFFRKDMRNRFLTKKTINYLKKYAPIGCRDIDSMNWLSENGIPAYFSGCLTFALEPNKDIIKQDYILCVDLKDNIVKEIKNRTERPVFNIPVDINPLVSREKRITLAKIYLRLYQEAHCIISNRFHAILPALAFDTPVLRIDTCENEREINSRFSGYDGFVYYVKTDKFFNDKQIYDFDNPPKNQDMHLEIKNKLVKICADFTGFDSKKSFVSTSDNPLMEVLACSHYDYSQIKKALYWGKKSDLIETYLNKMFLKKNKYDFKG